MPAIPLIWWLVGAGAGGAYVGAKATGVKNELTGETSTGSTINTLNLALWLGILFIAFKLYKAAK